MVAPERAILAALDTNLELAIRSLKAEHLALGPGGRLSADSNDEPHTFNLLPLVEALVLCAVRLRRLVGEYRTDAGALLYDADASFVSPSNIDEAVDDDIPF